MPSSDRGQLVGLVVGAALSTAAVVARAQDSGRPMSPDEVRNCVQEATAFQQRYEQVTAVFRVQFEVNLDLLPSNAGVTHPNLTYNGGTASATMRWWRAGSRERLDTLFDLPEQYKRQQYEDKIFFNDDDMQVEAFLRTSQVAVCTTGELRTMSPADWLLAGSRKALAERAAKRGAQAFAKNDGTIGLVVPDDPVKGSPAISYTLDPALNYAVTAWERADRAFPSSGTIEYAVDDRGAVLPVRSVLTVRQADGQVLRKSTLDVQSLELGAPDASQLRFTFKPGLTFTDNREVQENRGPVRVYRVREDGSWEELPNVSAPREQWAGFSDKTIGLAVVVALGVAVSLAARARAARDT